MRKTSISFLLLMMCLPSNAQAPPTTGDTTGLSVIIREHLNTVKKAVEKNILPGRYMCTGETARLISTTDTIPGWEDFPVQLFEYNIADKLNGRLTTQVYLLNADAEKIARWIIAACWMEKRKVTSGYIDAIVKQIDHESGGQFPIRGIVYEDLNRDSIQETYPFFDGVSVEHKEFTIITPKRAKPEQLTKYLSMIFADVGKIYTWGRIISTTREEYNVLFPDADVDGNNWCNIVRKEYKKAMRSDVNYLINAWVRGNL